MRGTTHPLSAYVLFTFCDVAIPFECATASGGFLPVESLGSVDGNAKSNHG